MGDNLKPKHGDESQVEMTHLVMPQDANTIGTVFGGQIVSWIDICASVVAQRHCRLPVVTVSIDSVHFRKPIKQRQIVILKGRINAVFRTSLEIGVAVFAEDPMTGESIKAVSAYLTFVALDAADQPAAIPGLIVESAEEKRREKAAKIRREQRLADRLQDTQHHIGEVVKKE